MAKDCKHGDRAEIKLCLSTSAEGIQSDDSEADSPADASSGSVLQARRRHRKQVKRERLQEFLCKYGFSSTDLNELGNPSKISKCLSFLCISESHQFHRPVHVAAYHGDAYILRLLLQARADPSQKTEKGETALDIAMERNLKGSHEDVMAVLSADVKFGSATRILLDCSQT
mmetsp:Transcript_52112/g.63823  ORF Transcript_52112/g.63823 Transcript_52112/m.63823 type:complete len:172 (+) Transcript_52112:116-631(+)